MKRSVRVQILLIKDISSINKICKSVKGVFFKTIIPFFYNKKYFCFTIKTLCSVRVEHLPMEDSLWDKNPSVPPGRDISPEGEKTLFIKLDYTYLQKFFPLTGGIKRGFSPEDG
jgi:hypothetical protein